MLQLRGCVRIGGMGLPIPSEISDEQYPNFITINTKLTAKFSPQQKQYEDINADVMKGKREVGQ